MAKTGLENTGIVNDANLERLCESVNTQRLSNMPFAFTDEMVRNVYMNLVKGV